MVKHTFPDFGWNLLAPIESTIQVAALFGVLGSGLGAAGTSVGLAAVNGAFGGNFTDWNTTVENLSPAERQQVVKHSFDRQEL